MIEQSAECPRRLGATNGCIDNGQLDGSPPPRERGVYVCVSCVVLTVLDCVRHGVAGDGVQSDDVDQRSDAAGGDVILVVLVEGASPQAVQSIHWQTVQHAATEERSGGRHR